VYWIKVLCISTNMQCWSHVFTAI